MITSHRRLEQPFTLYQQVCQNIILLNLFQLHNELLYSKMPNFIERILFQINLKDYLSNQYYFQRTNFPIRIILPCANQYPQTFFYSILLRNYHNFFLKTINLYRNRIQKMNTSQHPKSKPQFAYAKLGKSKPKQASKTSHPTPAISPRTRKTENIYQHLMGELNMEDSEYIQRLCKKNEQKLTKNKQEVVFWDRTNQSSQRSQPRSFRLDQPESNSSIKDVENINGFAMNGFQSNSEKSVRKNSQRIFLRNLDNYLAQLSQSSYKHKQSIFQENSESKNERQFRRTVQVGHKKSKRPEQISRAKYQQILDRLEDELVYRQNLQQKVVSYQTKYNQMKLLVQQMQEQMFSLRSEIIAERSQKEKYAHLTKQFMQNIERVNSKQKYYIPQHAKRNSHIPSSSLQREYSANFDRQRDYQLWQDSKQQFQKGDFEKTKQKGDTNLLKKKGRNHKLKISDFNLEGNQNSFRSRGSIYNDSFL